MCKADFTFRQYHLIGIPASTPLRSKIFNTHHFRTIPTCVKINTKPGTEQKWNLLHNFLHKQPQKKRVSALHSQFSEYVAYYGREVHAKVLRNKQEKCNFMIAFTVDMRANKFLDFQLNSFTLLSLWFHIRCRSRAYIKLFSDSSTYAHRT